MTLNTPDVPLPDRPHCDAWAASAVVALVLVAAAFVASPIGGLAMLAMIALFPALAWFVHSHKDQP